MIKLDLPRVPQALADVSLVTGPECAAAAGCGLSLWHDLVRTGRAPQPVIQQPRYTRWLISSIRTWLIEHASQPPTDDTIRMRAKKASATAREPAAVTRATRKASVAARVDQAEA